MNDHTSTPCPVCEGDGRMYYDTHRGPWAIECHWCAGTGRYTRRNPDPLAIRATQRVAERQRMARASIKPRLAHRTIGGHVDHIDDFHADDLVI